MRKLIFIFVFLFLLNNAKSQNVGIGTTNPLARLQVADSSVVFTSPAVMPGYSGNPPVSDAGSRMMWYAGKAAFRAGGVGQSQWNKDLIGNYSTAFGGNTTASGNISIATGYSTIASGDIATAIGYFTTASGANSTAMGGNTFATGIYSTAIGYGTAATGNRSTAMGDKTLASGEASTAMGYDTYAGGLRSTAMGLNTWAGGANSTAMGHFTSAIGQSSTSTGYGNLAYGFSSLVAGMFNEPIVTVQTSVSSNTPLFIVGNGNAENDKSNAMVVRKDGNVGIGTNTPRVKLHIANGTDADYSNDAGFVVIGSVNSSNLVFDNNEIIARSDGAGSILYLQSPGGMVAIGVVPGVNLPPSHLLDVNGTAGKPGGGSWSTYSDVRLKQNISPYTDGLASLMKINPVSFRYNKLSGYDTKLSYVGVIAQELQKISPYMVTETTRKENPTSTGYLEVDNSAMTYMLINAVKEQQKQIEELKAMVKELAQKK
jgi:Chaperone of endosialidase/Head domain of trimeric autotransporter adhesin